MAKVAESLAVLAVLAAMFFLGRMSKKEMTIAENATVIDTLWVQVHDTAFIEKAVTFLRHDTVRLAYVPENAKTGTFDDVYGYEKSDSGTCHDTVFVSVPISEYDFEGENYRILAEGYAVRLNDVWINYPTITATSTVTKQKRWAFGVGVQAGYGVTVHGFSPYAGLGVSFGYIF